jgi:PST family polysaccharide transporter
VPLLFEQIWQQNTMVVTVLCLAALPAILINTQCNVLRAKAQYQKELYVRIFCLIISSVGLVAVQASTPENFALNILACSTLWLLALFPWNKLELHFQNTRVLNPRCLRT